MSRMYKLSLAQTRVLFGGFFRLGARVCVCVRVWVRVAVGVGMTLCLLECS